MKEFDGSLPAIVNFHEAQAYCAWKSENGTCRLLTEAEQQALRQISGDENSWNHNLKYGSESPVHRHVSKRSGLGDIFGNVWQWSSDAFKPLPGFKPHRLYEDFSEPCFDGRHQMIFGGSFISTGDEASRWARFHFRPHFFQHAGFRVCRSSQKFFRSCAEQPVASDTDTQRLLAFKNQFSVEQNLIHLNNAGLAPVSRPAFEVVRHWNDRFYAEGVHCNDDYLAAVEDARGSLARLIGSQPSEVAFFQSTAGAASQIAFGIDLKAGDEILMWDQEYASHLYPWKAAADRTGAVLKLIASGAQLQTPFEKIIAAITSKTRVIALSWVQFQTGAITNIEPIVKAARERNIWVVLDVIQGVGMRPFNFATLGVDAVYGGSHKWLTSHVGVGYLAIKDARVREIKPLTVGSHTYGTCDDPADFSCQIKTSALKFESGSKQVLEILALGASAELFLATGVSVIQSEVERLALSLRLGLAEYGYAVHSPHDDLNLNTQVGSIVSFSGRMDTEEKLRKNKISFARRGPGLRLSPHAFNSDEDIRSVLNVLK